MLFVRVLCASAGRGGVCGGCVCLGALKKKKKWCGMPARGQAVGCGVCDTPELWCGAAGLCARVRACAGAAESLHTYIQNNNAVLVL